MAVWHPAVCYPIVGSPIRVAGIIVCQWDGLRLKIKRDRPRLDVRLRQLASAVEWTPRWNCWCEVLRSWPRLTLYVIPNTPDVISIGKRCVEIDWYSAWVPCSKRLVSSPPKDKGGPIYLSAPGNIPYVRERVSGACVAIYARAISFTFPSCSTSSEPSVGVSCDPAV